MTLRLFRKLFSAESIGLILVFVALGTMIYGISSSLSNADSGDLLRVCFISALLSLALAHTRLNGIPSAVIMIGFGIVGTWTLGAGLARPLLQLFRSLISISVQIFPEVGYRFEVDGSPFVASWQSILVASTALGIRVKTWYLSLGTNHVVSDPLIRNLIWVLIFWLLAAWIGWFTAKRSAVTALLPAIVVMAEVTSYSEYRIDSLWWMVLVLLLLMGVWNYRNTTVKWAQHKIDYSDSIRFDNGQAVLLLSVLLGLVAFITPSISWRDVRDYLRERQQQTKGETTAEIFGIKEPPRKPNTLSTPTPSLPREHLLSGGFAQSENVVMTIRTGELSPVPSSAIPIDAPRYYWRSTIYDQYIGAGWISSRAPAQTYKANTPLIAGVLDGYRPLHLDVQVQEPEGKLFWSGVLYTANTPFRADWRIRPSSDVFADQTALLQADAFQFATSATSYTAQTYVPNVTIEELRQMPAQYPKEIQTRYLQLPEELPGRVHQLAMQITQGKNNPYEKAKAIEAYLRKNFPYDLNIPAPPTDKDVADYFLFDLKRGYCDYYATAMVVMARSVGIPARFVSGYASGDYDAENARYIVRELHAHSWAEVYFPDIGWIEFEPTASQPEIIRPEKNVDIAAPQKEETNVSRFLAQFTHTKLIYWLVPVILTASLMFLYYTIFESVLLIIRKPHDAIEMLFQRYYRLARSLVGERAHAETAHEFTTKLVHKLEELYLDSNNNALTDARTTLTQFTNIYQLSLFSDHVIDEHDVRKAFKEWKQLRRFLTSSKIKNFFQIKNRWIKNKVTQLSFIRSI